VKKEIEKVGRTDIGKSIERAIDPKGDLSRAFDPSKPSIQKDSTHKDVPATPANRPPENAAPGATVAPAMAGDAAPAPAALPAPAPVAAAIPAGAATAGAATNGHAAQKTTAETAAPKKTANGDGGDRKPVTADPS
jgi:hypothetical protein